MFKKIGLLSLVILLIAGGRLFIKRDSVPSLDSPKSVVGINKIKENKKVEVKSIEFSSSAPVVKSGSKIDFVKDFYPTIDQATYPKPKEFSFSGDKETFLVMETSGSESSALNVYLQNLDSQGLGIKYTVIIPTGKSIMSLGTNLLPGRYQLVLESRKQNTETSFKVK